MNKKYIVKLTAEERAGIQQMISAGKAAARKLLHARILLKADASAEGVMGENSIPDALRAVTPLHDSSRE